MPYDNHLRLTASGVFQANAQTTREAWSFRVNLSDPLTVLTESELQARCDDYAADTVAFIAAPGTRVGSSALLLNVKLAQIGPDGLYTRDSVETLVNQRGGGGDSIRYPTQVSLAVSLGTDRRGPTGRGRFYLPAPISLLDGASFAIEPAETLLIRDSVVTWIEALNNVPGIDGQAPKVTVASSKGYNTDVSSVRVGRVLDTIRTRRTSLPELWTAESPVA